MTICTHCNLDVKEVCSTDYLAGNCACLLDVYVKALRSHDWFYSYSDDHSVWKRGQERVDKLRTMREKVDRDGKVWDAIAPEEYRLNFKRFEVTGYYDHGYRADVFYARRDWAALSQAEGVLRKLYPDIKFTHFIARLDE